MENQEGDVIEWGDDDNEEEDEDDEDEEDEDDDDDNEEEDDIEEEEEEDEDDEDDEDDDTDDEDERRKSGWGFQSWSESRKSSWEEKLGMGIERWWGGWKLGVERRVSPMAPTVEGVKPLDLGGCFETEAVEGNSSGIGLEGWG